MNRPGLLEQVRKTSQVHPICGLLGPRQSGKTTLARMYAEQFFPHNYYFFDLENPSDLTRLENPLLAIGQVRQVLIVIDEIQRRPDLFPVLRVLVDDPENKHQFLILGSASRDLIRQSSESLAGRIGYIDVMPFSLEEVRDVNQLWLRGGFPRSYLADAEYQSVSWRQNYIKTFLEQDIPALGFSIPQQQLRRFWMMLAHYHGNIFNASEIGKALGATHHTMKKYLDILVGIFMVRSLEPWFENVGKRQVKSSKIYFRDSGILHTLLTVDTAEQLYTNPKIGASWEGFALEEVIRCMGVSPEECFFWSTYAHAELDLLIFKRGKKLGFDFKYSDNPTITRSMRVALQELKLEHLYVIVPGNKRYLLDQQITVCGIDQMLQLVREL